ncbi:CdaR family protein [Bacillus sp. AK128]
MDKLMNNHWVMRIIALMLALMLYTSVNIETQTQQTEPFSFPVVTTETETLTDLPLEAYYDEENYVVTGLPQVVSVTLKGPRSAVQPIKLQRSIEVFVNLENLESGTHQVQVQYSDISDTVEVSINPTFVTVTIHEKVEKEFSVEVDFINDLEEGYTLDEPIISPKNVKVVGAKDQVDRIALVKAIVDLADAKVKIDNEATVAVYDSDGNRLAVEVEPEVVNVEVNILSPNKVVPISFITKGNVEDGYSLVDLETPIKELTIFGPKDVIDQIESIDNIEVDVEGLAGETTLNVEIPTPEGLDDIVPLTVPVIVKVERNEIRPLTDFPVKVIGVPTSLKADFITPEGGMLDIELIGAPSILKEIDETDLDIYIDVTNLTSGQHDVDILVNGPDNVKWNLSSNKATIEITNNE